MMLTIVDSAPLLFLLEPVLAAELAVADVVRVTPAKAQFWSAACSADWRSVPLQLFWKHVVVELTNTGSKHRQ